MEDNTRERGILTPDDREFLRGETNIEGQYERRVRQRIRNRVLHSIADFWYLSERLQRDDLELIFDPDRGKHEQTNPRHGLPLGRYTFDHEQHRTGLAGEETNPATTFFEEVIKDTISFFYQGTEHLPAVDFERVIEEGVTKAVREHGKTASVEIDTRKVEMDDLMKKAEEGELNREEILLILNQEDGE